MNKVETTPIWESSAFRYKVATLVSALVTLGATYLAAIEQPKNPLLATLILGTGTAITNFLNSQQSSAVKRVAIDAANQAANMGPTNGTQSNCRD